MIIPLTKTINTMMRNILFSLAIVAMMGSAMFAQNLNRANVSKQTAPSSQLSNPNSSPEKDAVKAFGLSIVKAYFDDNCDFIYDQLDNTIYSMESGDAFTKDAQLKNLFCGENPLREDVPVSYQMYLDNYVQTVYTSLEFKNLNAEMHDFLELGKTDFVFVGSEMKKGKTGRVFRASDMATFVVRKINGNWTITKI